MTFPVQYSFVMFRSYERYSGGVPLSWCTSHNFSTQLCIDLSIKPHKLMLFFFLLKDIFDYILFFIFQSGPPDISVCVFVLEQALSVRALQEMVGTKRDSVGDVFNPSKLIPVNFSQN